MPSYVVRLATMERDVYLQPSGEWSEYRTAKRFKNQDKADAAGEHTREAFGVFPCSPPGRTVNPSLTEQELDAFAILQTVTRPSKQVKQNGKARFLPSTWLDKLDFTS